MARNCKKTVLRIDPINDRQKEKAFKAISNLAGVDSIAVDTEKQNITVVGLVDPVDVVYKLRKLFATDIVSVWPFSEEKKEEKKKELASKYEYRYPEVYPSAIAEFTLEFLNSITNNFSKDRLIGCGRYGTIYKGVQDDGKCIAVMKLLHLKPVLGEEFRKEINKLAWVQHQNTIQLIGFCHHIAQVSVEHEGEHVSARVEERALCFEYLQGPSLDKHLSNEPCGLNWHTCYAIIRGICNGLCYLHKGSEHYLRYRHMGPEHPYHLDLKPTSILLDRYMIPKIGGFGLSRIFGSLQTNNISEDTETSLYMPPEYINRQEISPKVDVFSLGVIIIQIVAGKESYSKCADTSPEEFIQLVHQFWEKKMPETIWRHTSCEVRACIEIALKCVKSDPVMRPTMTEIVDRLDIDKIYLADRPLYYRTTEFTLNFLKGITNDFCMQNIVGRGGYGVIYKGVLDNGEEIAVKKLHPMSWIYEEHFKNELNNLMKVQHKNIVRLVGYCHHMEQIVVKHEGKFVCASVDQRALCLEYLQGGSLDKHLSDDEACKLDWDTCYKIIKGICHGLHYLHNGSYHPTYHLDLKPENILLDNDMMPKIGDFGLSRLFGSRQTHKIESRDVKGTRGYMPPEYIDRQIISPKFDVFSLGVIIIQMMAGKKGYYDCADTCPGEFVKLVHGNWLKRLRTTAMLYHASEEAMACIKIALRCVQSDRAQRPTITDIVNELNNIGGAKSLMKSTSQVTKAMDVVESRSHEFSLDASTSSSKQQDRTQAADKALPNSSLQQVQEHSGIFGFKFILGIALLSLLIGVFLGKQY